MSLMTKESLTAMTKEAHIDLYRMFCSACLINERDGHPEHTNKQRKIMAEMLSYGKISPEEAVEIETEMRATIPQLEAFLKSLEEGVSNPETQH